VTEPLTPEEINDLLGDQFEHLLETEAVIEFHGPPPADLSVSLQLDPSVPILEVRVVCTRCREILGKRHVAEGSLECQFSVPVKAFVTRCVTNGVDAPFHPSVKLMWIIA
jgi:hypothetical protein